MYPNPAKYNSLLFVLLFGLLTLFNLAKSEEIILVSSDISVQQEYIAFLEEVYGETANITTGTYTELDGNAAMLAELEAADLIIMARLNLSGNFDEGTEISDWNGLSVPMLNHSGYLTRTLRWDWMPGEVESLNNDSPNLVVKNAADPIFKGMNVQNGDTIQFFTSPLNAVSVQADSGNGILTASPEGSERVLFARWTGTETNYHPTSPYIPGGPRLFFATDEFNPMGTLSEQGRTMLRNALLSLLPDEEPLATITETGGITLVREKPLSSDSFSVVLNSEPSADVDVLIIPYTNINDIQLEGSSGPGQSINISFTTANWDVQQDVIVWAVVDDQQELIEQAGIRFQVSSDDPVFDGGSIMPVQVTVMDASDDICPVGDLNNDCEVNADDLVILVSSWLGDSGSIGNINADDTVNLEDMALFTQHWLEKRGPVLINEFMASNSLTILDGNNESSDWIELYNLSAYPVDLAGWYLTDNDELLDKWRFPSGTLIEPYDYLLVFASNKDDVLYPYTDTLGYLHTNFNLDANGEYLALIGDDGQTIIDEYLPRYPDQIRDISYGVFGLEHRYFITPTPLSANSPAYEGLVADTKFSHDRGYYTEPFEVSISCETEGVTIHYTTDGSEPDDFSEVYTEPIAISVTTCLRAVALKQGWHPSNIDTQTYVFINHVVYQSAPADYPVLWNGFEADYWMDWEVWNSTEYKDLIDDSLLSLPMLSVVTDKDNLFDPSTGIYLNTTQEGELWERPCSAEFFDPSGVENDFQIDCGLRIQGGASRNPANSPKHSLRLLFKSDYGSPKLEYPFFGKDAVDSFDTLVLRANYNNSWIHWDHDQRLRSQYIRDQWARDTQLDMEQVSAHGRFVHLYINGLYWGLYNVTERPQASFAANYYGGIKEEWDALNSSVPVDGNKDAWNIAQSIANLGVGDQAGFDALAEYVDIPNLIDFMINNFYGGNQDWDNHNWYAARRRVSGETFKFFCWDSERILEDPYGHNKTGTNVDDKPSRLYSQLRANPEFRMLFADRAHKHLFNGGTLTPQVSIERWMNRANEIDLAVIAESARWGDYRRDVHVRDTAYLFTKNDHWLVEQSRLVNNYFPVRADTLIQQLKDANLYPLLDAPMFNINETYQHGGYVNAGDIFSITAPEINQLIESELIEAGASVRAHVPDDDSLGLTWSSIGFTPDSTWTDGSTGTGVGYETNSGYETLIETDTEDDMYNKNTSVYCRLEFSYDGSDVHQLMLQMKYDDAFIVYLNGTEVHRTTNITNDTPGSATATSREASVDTYDEFDITTYKDLLVAGTNMLAIHGINSSEGSSDMLILPRLVAIIPDPNPVTAPVWYTTNGSDPRLTGGSINPDAVEYSDPVILSESTIIKARTFNDGIWSALNEATYAVDNVAGSLRITEIMYHPTDPNTEFIELKNISLDPINLNLVSFTNGIDFSFEADVLGPGEYIVVVESQTDFENKYGTGINIAGIYSGSLNNAGERIELVDAIGTEIHNFAYKDSWYDITDGEGFSLTIKDPTAADPNLWDDKQGWRPSAALGGSPGEDDTGVIPAIGSVVINETLAHSDTYPNDWIELHNTTDQIIPIGGWFLSDNNNDDASYMKYRIADGTSIPANDYIVFTQDDNFGELSTDPGGIIPFALSENGETIYLRSGAGNASNYYLTGYYEEESFGASEVGVAFGRHIKSTLDGGVNFVAMSENTPDEENAYPKVGPVIINEIMYNPPAGGSYDHDEYEYIELYNISGGTVNLQDWDSDQGIFIPWKFTDGVDYTFPLGTSIPSGGKIVVVKNPAAFSERYPLVESSKIFGPFVDSQLSNGGEKVELAKPGDEVEGVRYYIRVDRVNYSDGSHPEDFPSGVDPWPISADGAGDSLNQKTPTLEENNYSNDVINWEGNVPSPGE